MEKELPGTDTSALSSKQGKPASANHRLHVNPWKPERNAYFHSFLTAKLENKKGMRVC